MGFKLVVGELCFSGIFRAMGIVCQWFVRSGWVSCGAF